MGSCLRSSKRSCRGVADCLLRFTPTVRCFSRSSPQIYGGFLLRFTAHQQLCPSRRGLPSETVPLDQSLCCISRGSVYGPRAGSYGCKNFSVTCSDRTLCNFFLQIVLSGYHLVLERPHHESLSAMLQCLFTS
ncbi:unnamed protein product [Schistocephalus solidus]|uniref:Uncharacterized protein n=1 Tax=Schistocephalus solidus TaxID=70667 RepID=A0A3P7DH27_SCHSO|nr:unnamed protein product [Schistocephalus solidus]